MLDNTGKEMINQGHYASDVIERRLGKKLEDFNVLGIK